jgi:nitrite reductase (NADH) small subunit
MSAATDTSPDPGASRPMSTATLVPVPTLSADAGAAPHLAGSPDVPAGAPEQPPAAGAWVAVCRVDDLQPERGAAALVAGVQVALFRLWDGAVHAVSHLDPYSGAHVMARGLVGSRGDAPTVASPMYKQVFDLRTGACLSADGPGLRVFGVRVVDGRVEVSVEPGSGT